MVIASLYFILRRRLGVQYPMTISYLLQYIVKEMVGLIYDFDTIICNCAEVKPAILSIKRRPIIYHCIQCCRRTSGSTYQGCESHFEMKIHAGDPTASRVPVYLTG